MYALIGPTATENKYSQPLNLPANQWHEIEASEDNTVFTNIFSEEAH